MMRIFATVVVVATIGHLVCSHPQIPPLSNIPMLGNNVNNGSLAEYGNNFANMLNMSAFSGFIPNAPSVSQFFPIPGGETQTAAPSAERKKRSPAGDIPRA
jgi:hypothetical protein